MRISLRGICPVLLLTALFVAAMAPAPAQAEGAKWEVINREEGITVLQKDVEGKDLPIFQGRADVNASIYVILGVLNDFDHHCEWQHGCREAKLLKTVDDFNRISYNRTRAPWPVDDRDVVLRANVTVEYDKKAVMIRFNAIKSPLKGEVDGVIRMVRLRGYYRLIWLSDTKTRVQYQVDADPGGWLPDWVVKMASEDIPLNTLRNLRKQIKRVKGRYDHLIEGWQAKYGW